MITVSVKKDLPILKEFVMIVQVILTVCLVVEKTSVINVMIILLFKMVHVCVLMILMYLMKMDIIVFVLVEQPNIKILVYAVKLSHVLSAWRMEYAHHAQNPSF